MKLLIALICTFLLCSCADMRVVRTQVAGGGGYGRVASGDSKDGIHMVVNCGVGAGSPKAIYIRPFCIDTAAFVDDTGTPAEAVILKAITPLEFANDLKDQLAKLAPTRILKDDETPRTGWLVQGEFTVVQSTGNSRLALHVKIVDVDRHRTVYEFDMDGGRNGEWGSIKSAGHGRASHFDLENAAERIYLVLEPNPFRYGKRTSLALHE
jgi:hypothetical protein